MPAFAKADLAANAPKAADHKERPSRRQWAYRAVAHPSTIPKRDRGFRKRLVPAEAAVMPHQ
jgi:hypothetical protein